tara:strand:+ start:8220 stop:9803 length:1584 start_codon:yes stop_codon:yes gene_type:complete
MEMMGLGFMPRIVLEGGGGGGGEGGMDEAEGLNDVNSYSADKGEIGGVVGADKSVATGAQLKANIDRAKERNKANKAYQAFKENPKDQDAVAQLSTALDVYDQAVQTANKAEVKSQPNPELAAFRPKSRPKSFEAKAKAIADKKAADAKAATIAATVAATDLTKEAVEANINSATNTDDKWGYTKADGTPVSAIDDARDGGGKNIAGAGFAFSGGRAADRDGDGFVTAEEAEAVGGLQGNFASGISNSIGATPYGSGLAPTGLAAIASMTPQGMLYGALRDLSRGESRKSIAARTGYTAPGPGYTIGGGTEGESGSNDSGLVDEGMPSDQFRRENTYSTRPTSETYTRRYKGGGLGAYSPSYLRQYASGQKINELVREVTLADGSKAYLTPDGKYLEMDQFANTATGSDVEIDTGEERYVSGYKLTDAVGNMTEYDAAGNIVYPSLYSEYAEAPAYGQPGSIQGGFEDGFVTPLPSPDPVPGIGNPIYGPDFVTPLPSPDPVPGIGTPRIKIGGLQEYKDRYNPFGV